MGKRLPSLYSYPMSSNLQVNPKENNDYTIILSSVLGFAAVVAITMTVVCIYFNS
jgi:hypothetical protein